ncbi:hypothetical protein MMC30_006227 [Trapelia coarctata]|nr:hypothetical protein [Trapelia coarctata]
MPPRQPPLGLYLKVVIGIAIILTIGLYILLFRISPWLVVFVIIFNVVGSFSFTYSDQHRQITYVRTMAARMEEDIEFGRYDEWREEDMDVGEEGWDRVADEEEVRGKAM